MTKLYHSKLLVSLLLIVAILVAYWQAKNFDFVGIDDGLYVTANRHVQAGLTIEGFIWAFTTTHAANWHPLTWLSHMLDCEVYGLNPMGHHLTNLLFHSANTLLLFFIFQYMTGAFWRSALVAALFALHPLHVESVAWVAERKDVLSTFFGMLTIAAYCRYVKKNRFINYLLSMLFLSLGLMAKPMLVTLPFVLLLLDFWPLKRFQYFKFRNSASLHFVSSISTVFRLISEKIPLFVLVVISSVTTLMAQSSEGAVESLESFPLKIRIANAFVSYVSYVAKTVWPHQLSVFYPHPGDNLPVWQVCGAALLIAGVVYWAIRASRQYPYIMVGLFWYLGTLAPVIGLVQVGPQAMADRYTYIPLTGLFIIIVWGVSDLSRRWNYRKIILSVSGAVLLSALTACTFLHVSHWKNSTTLFENAIKINNNELLHNTFCAYLFARGKLDKAVFHCKEAIRIYPEYVEAHNNLANILFAQGKLEEAAFHYKEALKINPECAVTHYNFGNLLIKQEKIKDAIAHFAEAVKINPDFVQAYNQVGLLLARQGKYKKACVFFSEAIQIDPNYTIARKNLERYSKFYRSDKRLPGNDE